MIPDKIGGIRAKVPADKQAETAVWAGKIAAGDPHQHVNGQML